MARLAAEFHNVSVEGEIVEILEEAGRRLGKIVLTAPVVVDLPAEDIADPHLGDRIVLRGWFTGIGTPKEDV